jgi:aconitate hydratase
MIKIIDKGTYLLNGKEIRDNIDNLSIDPSSAKKGTISYAILTSHNVDADSSESSIPENLRIKFDAMASHDITYVGIVQTARASGLKEFPVPYALTNCHNSLCAVGGTINEDDHAFGLSAAKKYGGIYVPAHLAVIHQYVREMLSGGGKMILGSDSHTRYGALGTMSMGEGGPELVKQLLSRTYNIKYPEVIGVFLKGAPAKGVGPQDVAIALIGAVFGSGFVKNKVLEFIGPGIANLSVDFRNGIDVMTTETTCLSAIWVTDEKVEAYYKTHGRSVEYKKLAPKAVAYYDGMIEIDLDKIKPMIALPFHPSNAFTIEELCQNPGDILREAEIEGTKQIDNPSIKLDLTSKIVDGKIKVDQGIVAGCAGGMYENVAEMASILRGHSTGSDKFSLSVYPASQPIYLEMVKKGIATELMVSGAVMQAILLPITS